MPAPFDIREFHHREWQPEMPHFVLNSMRVIACALLVAMASCSPVPAVVDAPAAARLAQVDVEKAVVERFGSAALTRARSADQFVAVLRYPGLPLPDHNTDGRAIVPSYPTALLFWENGHWFAYGADGSHQVLPRWSDQLNSLLSNPRLWSEPVTGGPIGCTDAGASYAWVKVRDHAEHTRIGHCGGSPLTEELVSVALMG